MERIFPRVDRRKSQQSRMLLGVSGGVLLLYGMRRRSLLGGLFSLAGVDLLTRGLTGHNLLEFMGVTSLTSKGRGASLPHQLGIQVNQAIAINLPAPEVYQFVRDFSNFPRFISHLKTIQVQDSTHSRWVMGGPRGAELECDIETINDIENKLIAWRSVNSPDVDAAGSVRFEQAPQGRGSILRFSLQYLPAGGRLVTAVAKLLGHDPESGLKEDLRRLKQVLETGEVVTTVGQSAGDPQARRPAGPAEETPEPFEPSRARSERTRAASAS
jgi:uncharacterized membrane protein